MIRLVRITGFLFIGVGALLILTWLIEPLQELWVVVLELPLPIRIGLAMAGIGLLILLGSLIWERYEDRENDRSLLDEP
ncbi:MAG: hypothetical protein AAGB93_21135 [Planctomycetota bacterium]